MMPSAYVLTLERDYEGEDVLAAWSASQPNDASAVHAASAMLPERPLSALGERAILRRYEPHDVRVPAATWAWVAAALPPEHSDACRAQGSRPPWACSCGATTRNVWRRPRL